MSRLVYLAIALPLVACTDAPPSQEPQGQVDLRAAFGSADVQPIGLAIAPNGDRFIFDETSGLYRLDGDVATPVVPMSALPDPGPEAPVRFPVTDIVALGANQFAITAIGDGYLLDTSAMTLVQHFCYVPDSLPEYLVQRTDALAYDAATDKLLAQPLTFDEQGVFQYSQVAEYERTTGIDTAWYAAEAHVAATGMIVAPSLGGIVLGQGSHLSIFDRTTQATRDLADLASYGVKSIDGLALDDDGATLVVVDQVVDAVFEIAVVDLIHR